MTNTLATTLRYELERFVDERLSSLGQRLAEGVESLDFAAELFEATLDEAVSAECVALRLLEGIDAEGLVALGDALHVVVDEVAVAAQEAVLLELCGIDEAQGEVPVVIVPALSALMTSIVDAGGEGTRATLSVYGSFLRLEAEPLAGARVETPQLAIALGRAFGSDLPQSAPWELAIPLSRFVKLAS